MSTKKGKRPSRSTLSAAFDGSLSAYLIGLRREIDRRPAGGSTNLKSIEATLARLRLALKKVSRRQAGDLVDRMEELDYPISRLHDYFAKKDTALDKRATEIMAEYVRDRVLEIRIVAETQDAD